MSPSVGDLLDPLSCFIPMTYTVAPSSSSSDSTVPSFSKADFFSLPHPSFRFFLLFPPSEEAKERGRRRGGGLATKKLALVQNQPWGEEKRWKERLGRVLASSPPPQFPSSSLSRRRLCARRRKKGRLRWRRFDQFARKGGRDPARVTWVHLDGRAVNCTKTVSRNGVASHLFPAPPFMMQ